MIKLILLTLTALLAVGQLVVCLDVGNVAKWQPATFDDKSELVETIKTVLRTVAEQNDVNIVTIDSFAFRPLMIGREYRTIYHGLSKTVSCKGNIFFTLSQQLVPFSSQGKQ